MKKKRIFTFVALAAVLAMVFSIALTGCGTVAVTGVSLDKATLTLTKGDKATLAATVTPEDATDASVSWTSDKTAVATVSADGEVTAVGGGTATITVKTTDGEKTAACTVTVKSPVTGVSLDEATARLAVGAEMTLNATVAPADATNKNVTWTSSVASVASVTDGVVTAKAAGTTKITVTTADGGKTAECTVTVYIPADGVTLNKTELQLVKGTTEKLTATVSPADATDKAVAWSSNNEAVATVAQDGTVTAVKTGTANITVTTADGGKTAVCAVTVYIPPAGVELNETALGLLMGKNGTLTATITPADATDKTVAWSSDQESVATVDAQGTVTAVATGTANITATTTDGGKTASCAVTVYDFNDKPGELTLTAALSDDTVMAGNKANSLVGVNAEAPGTLYYTTKSGLTGRDALIADTTTKSVTVDAGENYVMLEIANTDVLGAYFLLVETLADGQTEPAVDTAASDVVKVEWTADDFFTPDTSNGEIATWTDLKAALAKNENITLACNIDAAGEAYAPTVSGYSCTFDGRGHSIIGLNLTPAANTFGLFKTVKTPAVIKDLGFIAPTVNAGTFTEGGLIAGTNDETGDNVITVSGVTVGGLAYHCAEQNGGLFGRIKGNTTDLRIKDCNIDGTFFATGNRVGGLISYSDYNSKISIDNCEIDVTFDRNDNGDQKAGIIGFISGDAALLNVSGSTVRTTAKNCKGDQYASVAGQCSAAQITVDGCDIGMTLNDSKSTRQGAIVGITEGVAKVAVTKSRVGTTLKGVYTDGEGAVSSDERKGGLIGATNGESALTVDNCYVDFVVDKENLSMVGGIVGTNEHPSTVTVTHTYVNMDFSTAPEITGPAFGYIVSSKVTIRNSILVTNHSSNPGEIFGSDAYLNKDNVPVIENTDVADSSDAITAALAAEFADTTKNPDGSALWNYDEETNTLTFVGQ